MSISTLYNLNHDTDESNIVLIPAPIDITTSYTDGTSEGPEAILKASSQCDLFNPDFPDITEFGIAMKDIPSQWVKINNNCRPLAKAIISRVEKEEPLTESEIKDLEHINKQMDEFTDFIRAQVSELYDQNKLVGVVGGEHSVSLGAIQAVSTKVKQFGVLQIDAHMDLRDNYQGFKHSHASVMHNVLETCQNLTRLVQVGIRDHSHEEQDVVDSSKGRIKVFSDLEIKTSFMDQQTKSWQYWCKRIINSLPDAVYISCDIDGLTPNLCPNTGTPVPGGLTFEQLAYLIKQLGQSKKKILGFDLVEVAPGKESEWDANVGARVLYQLIGYCFN